MSVSIYRPPRLNLSSMSGYLEASIEAGQYSNNGPAARRLTRSLSEHVGVPPEGLVLASNATVALEAAMATASSIAPTSASWEVPSWSFAASGLAGINAKVDLRFVDVSPDLGVAQLSGMRNDCFGLGVAPFGGSISEEIYRAFKLIDAAASFDAVRDSGKSLSPEQGVVVSLHATKLVSAGEGGFFFSHDLNWVERVRSYLSFGFRGGGRESMSFGTNGKLSEIAAAAALASLEDWPHNRERLLVLGKLAVEKSNLAGLEVVGGLAGGYATPYWVVRCKTIDDREGLRQSLESRGIETRLWWAAGMHRMPAFAGIPGKSSLPETDRWASTYLGLPMHTHLDPAEIEMIGLILQEQAM